MCRYIITWRRDRTKVLKTTITSVTMSSSVVPLPKEDKETQEEYHKRLRLSARGYKSRLTLAINAQEGLVNFFQAEDGIRDCLLSRGLGDVYKRQLECAQIAVPLPF